MTTRQPPPPTDEDQALCDVLSPVHESRLPREHSLYRPRHGSRQAVALVAAAIFFATPLLAMGVGVRPAEFENRALAQFPSISDGWSFFTGLSAWATDHLVLRAQAVHVADEVSRSVFGEPPVFDRGRDGPIDGGTTGSDLPRQAFPNVVEGTDGWLYLGHEVESHCVLDRPLSETLEQLRRLHAGVEASGRPFLVVIAPDKTTIAPEYLPPNMPGAECLRTTTDEFWRVMTAEDYVVDLRPDLRWWESVLGAPAYGHLDAHWSDEGGVSMARQLVEHLQPGGTTSWRIHPGEQWTTTADLPPLIGRSGQTEGRHYDVRPDGRRNLTREVRGDFTAPLNLSTADGPGTYPHRVALLGDSFTYRALRYLAAAFQDITVFTHKSIPDDFGRTAGTILADADAVVVEVAERTLVSGRFGLLVPEVVDNVVQAVADKPVG